MAQKGFDNILMMACLALTSILYTHSISVTKGIFDDGCTAMGVGSSVVACTSLGAGMLERENFLSVPNFDSNGCVNM